MSKYGSSYQGNNFLEWWKHHYGTDYDGTSNISKTENMTEEDFAIGQTLLSNYQKTQKIESDFQESSNKLLENYTAAKDTLDKNKHQAQQNASITLDKLKKYLPTQIKAQGLGGLGVSESSMLQAYNNYSRDMGAIESENAQKVSDLERAYGESVGNLEREKNNLLYYADKDENGNLLVDNVLQEYAKMLSDEQEKTREGQYLTEADNIRVMYESMIAEDGKISQADYDKLAAYVEEKGTPLGDSYLALLNSQLNGYKNTVRDQASQDAIDKQTSMYTPTINNEITIKGNLNTANDNHGDNFEISYNGTTYKIEKGYDASDDLNRKLMEAYASSTGTAPAKGAVMIYGGRIYMYLENNNVHQDRWCVVQQRQSSYADHFANLCKALGLTIYSRDYKDG